MASPAPMQPATGSVPDPDPTARTVEQMKRDIEALRDLLESKVGGSREVIETRLSGMDKAIELLQATTNKIPSYIKDAVGQLERLHDEKFESIGTQFSERDVRSDKSEVAQKTAVDAALAGAEKAVGKTELSFTKQIDQIGQRIDTVSRSADEKISDLKERIQSIESQAKGSDKTTDRTASVIGMIIAGAVAFVVIMTAIVSVVAFIVTRSPSVTAYQPPPNAVTR